MALFPQDALNPGVRKREVVGWAMYDFANSGYTTVVLTAVFNAYFVGVVAGNAPWATFAWTLAIAISSAVVMVVMPALGAWADLRAAKKRLLLVVTAGCVATTAGLALVGRGDIVAAALLIIVSNTCFAIGESLTAAFLPELARRDALGRVSGWGWSFGYLGGMLALGISLAYVVQAQSRGLAAAEFVPVTMLITAGIYGAAAAVTFALLREHAAPQNTRDESAGGVYAALRRLGATWQHARQYSDFIWLLGCGASYQAGIAVVIALAAVYAEQALGFRQADTMQLVFMVNIAAAVGAFGFGYFQDRAGHKNALAWTLAGWIVMTVLAVLARTPNVFWVAAVVAGLCMGSSQSAGRALAGALMPTSRRAEFYGLWTFATRLSAIVGPLTYGAMTWLTEGNHRAAILTTGAFFALGLVLLGRIDVARGQAAALQT